MSVRNIRVLVVIFLAMAGQAGAQLSGYASHARVFHQNPLLNSASIFDRLSETFGECVYGVDGDYSSLQLKYTGALMTFDRFAERNSYEHSLKSFATFSYAPHPAESDSDQADAADDPSPTPDSAGSFLDIGLGVSARHDKEAFTEFDNSGIQSFASYRFHLGDSVVCRATIPAEYRRYVNLDMLSNLLSEASLIVTSSEASQIGFGILASGGYKYYTSSLFDTTRFETKRTFVVKASGKGKGGAVLVGPSSKQILINPQSNGIVRLSVGAFCTAAWAAGTARIDGSYALEPGANSRYIAQTANTTTLSGDIYNDHFAYGGPSASISLAQRLFLQIFSTIHLEFQRKYFGAPALDLDGIQTAGNRIDLRGSASWSLSRKFVLSSALSLECTLTAEAARNRSNDMSNDYSYTFASGAIGINF